MPRQYPQIIAIIPLLALHVILLPLRLAAQDVVFTLMPGEIQLSPSREAQAVALLDNKGRDALTEVKLMPIANKDVDVRIESKPASRLEPGSQCLWLLSISRKSSDNISTRVFIGVSYRGAGNSQGSLVQALAVKPHQLQAVDAIAELQVKGSNVPLNKNHVGEVYLIIANKSSIPFEITGLTIKGMGDIRCELDASTGRIEAGESRTMTVSLHADSAKTGKYLLLFEVGCKWTEANTPRTCVLRETREVEVAVPGVSEILSALGVPSFLVLPGFLLLAAIGLSWKMVKPNKNAGEFPLKMSTPDFWVVAVTYSIMAVWLYPWLGVTGDYIDGYTQRDVAGVWIVSIVIGIGIYFFGVTVYRLLLWSKSVRLEITVDDKPARVLRKLSNKGLPVAVKKVTVKDPKGEFGGYLLEEALEGKTTVWIGPRMVLRRIGDDPDKLMILCEQCIDDSDAARLSDIVNRGIKEKVLSLEWDAVKQLTGPTRVQRGDVILTGTDEDIVSIE